MNGITLLDWLFDYFFPIFIDAETLNSFTLYGKSLRELVAYWLVLGFFAVPALSIYFSIKKGRRLL